MNLGDKGLLDMRNGTVPFKVEVSKVPDQNQSRYFFDSLEEAILMSGYPSYSKGARFAYFQDELDAGKVVFTPDPVVTPIAMTRTVTNSYTFNPMGIYNVPLHINIDIIGPSGHGSHEVVDNVVLGKSFRYCRDCRIEV